MDQRQGHGTDSARRGGRRSEPRSRRRTIVGVALPLVALVLVAVAPALPGGAADDPVAAAWEHAREAGTYAFSSDVTQTATPVASVRNVGRTSRTEHMHLAGHADLDHAAMEFDLWSGSATRPTGSADLSLRHLDGQTFQRSPDGQWQPAADDAAVATPGGDMLSYLSAARDVSLVDRVEMGGEVFEAYAFTIDGPDYAATMAQQMRRSLEARGELTPGTVVDPAPMLRDMTGHGQLWIDATGFPVRQVIELGFPEQDGEQMQARIDVTFSDFGVPHDFGLPGETAGATLFNVLGGLAPVLLLALLVLGLLAAAAQLNHAGRPVLVRGLAIALAISMLITGPAPDEAQATAPAPGPASAADLPDTTVWAQDALASRATTPDPHQSLLAVGPRTAPDRTPQPTAPSTRQLSPTLDTDGDNLSDQIELTIGTLTDEADSDGDGVDDDVEVAGFSHGGQDWYLDPFEVDSNHDGIADGLELDLNDDDVPDDTDGNGTPDVFDDDNDGDGVHDSIDLNPAGAVSTPFSDTVPFRYAIDGLATTGSLPVFVDFQLRPDDPDHLRLANSPFDWPRDDLGQIRDIDGGPDDIRLVPMLEIAIPDGPHVLPGADAMEPFAVTVTDANTSGDRVAYVPLSLVSDESTGEAMAFAGRMRYQSQADWGPDHEARLIWAVSMDNDVRCDPEETGCEADGYSYNQLQIVHRYADDWALTGLQVSEQHGSEVAVAYEDPAEDNDIDDAGPTWALSHVMDQRFMSATDLGGGNLGFEVTTDNLKATYDHRNNGRTTPYNLPDVFAVETSSHTSFDEAAYETASGTNSQILEDAFGPAWSGGDSVRPLLLTMWESRTRSVSADALSTGDAYITHAAGRFAIDMAPVGAPPATINTFIGMRWQEYCGGDGASPDWRGCTPEETFERLEQRYGDIELDNGAFPGIDTTDPEIATGQNMVMYLHAMAMNNGLTTLVSRDPGNGSPAQPVHQFVGDADAVVDAVAANGLGGASGGVAKLVSNLILLPRLEDGNEALLRLSSLGVRGDFDTFLANRNGYSKFAMGAGIAIGIAGLITAAVFSQLGNEAATAVLSLTLAAGQIAAGIIGPVYSVVQVVRAGEMSGFAALMSGSETVGTAKTAGLVGMVVAILAIWGFTLYSVISTRTPAFSAEFNAAIADAFAATYTVVLLTVLAFTVVGLILVAIVAVVDLLFAAICALSDDSAIEDEEGRCFGLSLAFTEFVSKVLYSFDVMVDLEADDLIDVGAPDIRLRDPGTGFAVGGHVDVDLPVTTRIAHNDPDGADSWHMIPYLWFFSPDNLRSSTVEYSLTGDEVALTPERGTMRGLWDEPVFDHEYLTRDLYRTQTGPVDVPFEGGFALDTPGVNRRLDMTFNSGFAVPASECWVVPWLVIPPVPICYKRSFEQHNSSPLDPLYFDVLPPTLDGFVNVPDASNGVEWADDRPDGSYPAFPALDDIDQDGLLSSRVGGLDPNDRLWDTDLDGLSDARELELREQGIAISPGLADTDADGVGDAREIAEGTHPGVVDTDNDGLTDAQELEGWQITVTGHWDLASESARTVHVTSNPLAADEDGDGVNDLAEKQLAEHANPDFRIDEDGNPFHPSVANVAPLAVQITTDDEDSVVAPGQQVLVSSAVTATAPVEPGVVDLTAPAAFAASPDPARLDFDPGTFDQEQTATDQTSLTVGQATSGDVLLAADARTRLEDLGPGGIEWLTDTQPALAGVRTTGLLDLAARHPDRGDSFMMGEAERLTPFPASSDVRAFPLPPDAGAVQLDNDSEPYYPFSGNRKYRSAVDPDVACNDAGECLTVWKDYDNCTTVRLNWLKVIEFNGDPNDGIEPALYFATRPGNESTYSLRWFSSSSGGNDMVHGEQRGPNANNFPRSSGFCGTGGIYAREIDSSADIGGSGTDDEVLVHGRHDGSSWSEVLPYIRVDEDGPRTTTASMVTRAFMADKNGTTSCPDDACIHIHVNYTVLPRQAYRVTGSVVNASGTEITSEIDTPYDPAAADVAVASDGTNFAIVSEDRLDNTTSSPRPYTGGSTPGSDPNGFRSVKLRTYDRDGVMLQERIVTVFAGTDTGKAWYDVEWTGEEWLVAVQHPTSKQVSLYALDPTGGSRSPVGVATVTGDPWYASDLAHDPVSGRSLVLTQTADGDVHATVRDRDFAEVASGIILTDWNHPRGDYNPMTGGWLITADRPATAPRVASVGPLLEDPDVRPAHTSAGTVPAVACPTAVALPVADLRFEELPGATTFADSSPAGNNAQADAAGPTAGHPGAADAAASDHAVRFDSSGDTLTLDNPVAGDAVTLSFWYRSADGAATGDPLVLSAGGPSGYALSVYPDGSFSWSIGGTNTGQVLNDLNDGEWHFVAATRDRAGRAAIHVDGVRLIEASLSAPGSAATLTVTGGGSTVELDHLRVHQTGLSDDAVTALYERTASTFCVSAAMVGGTPVTYPWTRHVFNEIDPRGGRLSASGQLRLTVDADAPTSTVAVPEDLIRGGVSTLMIGGTASDPTSDVALVEVRVDGRGWAPASGTEAWSFALPLAEGSVQVESRATDVVGNVGAPSAPVTVSADGTAPTVTLDPLPTGPVGAPLDADSGRPSVGLSGSVSDTIAGVADTGVEVLLVETAGRALEAAWQSATVAGGTWSIDYLFGATDPTGSYDVRVRAIDRVGNATADAPVGTLVIDAAAPAATLDPDDVLRRVIADPTTIGGTVVDAGGSGISTVDIAFTPLTDVVTDQPIDWRPATLTAAGPGVALAEWSFAVPGAMENFFQIDLRTTDLAGNTEEHRNLWRGVIDTQAPGLILRATPTGETFRRGSRHGFSYRCHATDLFLVADGFDCPGTGLQVPVRTFLDDPVIQAEFPDQVLLTELEADYFRWERTLTPTVEFTACDRFGNCTTIDNSEERSAAVPRGLGPAVQATIVGPREGAHVASDDGTVGIHVSADAGDATSFESMTLVIDGVQAVRQSFQPGTDDRIDQLVDVGVAGGTHTADVTVVTADGQAVDATTVSFFVDTQAPAVTLATTTIDAGGTWGLGTGMVRFGGSASDDGQIAAVQINVDGDGWVEAIFDQAAGTWRAAVLVADPDGRDLDVAVRAFDLAGRMTVISDGTDVQFADAGYLRPDTTIDMGSPSPTPATSAAVVFSATPGDAGVGIFTCQLDNGDPVVCESPWSVADLSVGDHTIQVTAVDTEGLEDLTPAVHAWTVSASGPQATLRDAPDDPTTDRTGQFTFGLEDGATAECALDGAPFAPCASPVELPDLRPGVHTFRIRVTHNGATGTPSAHTWTVLNDVPRSRGQAVSVRVNDPIGAPVTLRADDADPLTYRITQRPEHGFLEGTGADLSYVPFANFVGVDEFWFVADDGQAISEPARVGVRVREPSAGETEPVDEQPDAAPDDPTGTAIAISQQRFDDAGSDTRQSGRTAAHVVLSRDDTFADSLAASVLTAEAPLLFTATGALDQRTEAEIQRLLGGQGRILLLGGDGAISQAVEDRLVELGYDTTRLAGPSRIETAIAVADHVLDGPPTQVALARAFGPADNPTAAWADAVAAGGWAASTGTPILLSATDQMHPAVDAWLAANAPGRHLVLGGPAAIDDAVVAGLDGVERVAGPNRYATAVAVVDQLWPAAPDGWLITAGDHVNGWAYALAAAGLAADRGDPLLLVETDRLPDATDQALACADDARPAHEVIGDLTVVAQPVRDALATC